MVYNPKRFIKKNFGRFKNRNRSGNFNSEKSRDEGFRSSEKDEEKQEKKLLGDSGYDCNYCHEDEIDEECYKCDSRVSSEEVSHVYRVGLDKIEAYIQSKDHKNMLKQVLDEKDKDKNKSDTVQKFDSLCTKLSSKNTFDTNNVSEFDESDMSEISVEDEIDLRSPVQNLKSTPVQCLKPNSVPKQVAKPTVAKLETNAKSQVSKPFEKSKLKFSSKSNFSKTANASKDVKDKGKLVSEPKISSKDFEAQLKKGGKETCGCSHHMIGRREELREFRTLKNGGKVKYGNNATGEIKGCNMIMNGKFTIRKVAYVEGLEYNLISVSQLVVGTGLKVSFNDEGSEIIEKKTKVVLLKSKTKGEMFPLNIKPIVRKPTICLLTKASSDDSWLWHRRLSHFNFMDISKLVFGDLVQGLPLLKYDREHLCATCELGKKSWKSHSTIINSKINKPLELLHIDLCGPSAIKSVGGNKYILCTDNGSEFKNQMFEEFLTEKRVAHNFSAPVDHTEIADNPFPTEELC
ncbi:uncharacterized protein LOC111877429 [Lactuca sativa]|uniref:uncharacterized protein LOC111877429 n=1 Tax=Lactuca sativa TaxID=4236 RepID=UPI000CD81C64|nr:uncharacterized protein LOC111877429 [Lactuca sativa]